jgi:flagellar basal body rod protein FlgG
MSGAALAQDVIAENLANVNVPGYRRRAVTFQSFEGSLDEAAGDGNLLGSRVTGIYDDANPGPTQATGNPLDLVASGNTYFVLDGPEGPVYTRNGVFRLNAEGQLESASGLKVKGEGGVITIPPETSKITISRDGTVTADGTEVGQLRLVQIRNLAGMQRVGTTLFSGPANLAETAEPGTALVEQGYREGSNVQVVQEMVSMILGMRHYEAAQRAMRGLADSVGLSTRPAAE